MGRGARGLKATNMQSYEETRRGREERGTEGGWDRDRVK